MRIVLIFFWFAACLFAPASVAGAAEPVRIVTWNLQWFPGRSTAPTQDAISLHIAEVKASLALLSPDILILEEVSSEGAVEEAIHDLPGLKVAVVSRFKTGAGFIDGQQIAIVSRFPAAYVHSESWKAGWAGAPRGFAFAAFDVAGERIGVYGLHLKSNLGDPEGNTAKREDSVEQLLVHKQDTSKEDPTLRRWVVAGDLNTDIRNKDVPSERTFPLLEAAGFFWTFKDVPDALRITCPAKGRYPAASFDHIFVLGLERPVAAPRPEITGSDHLPVEINFLVPSD